MSKQSQNQVQTRFKEPKFRPTFIRQWREKRNLTQEQLCERLEMSTGNLSQIENGHIGYTQATLEAIAVALDVEPVDLLIRDPSDPEGIWSLWDRAEPGQRKQLIGMISGFLNSSVA